MQVPTQKQQMVLLNQRNRNMAKAPFIKHVGRHSGTGQRISVVFMQLPDDINNALVVYSDSLRRSIP